MRNALLAILVAFILIGGLFSGAQFILSQKIVPSSATVRNGNPHDPHNLPLGDGRIGGTPAKGSLMTCQSRFFGGGAFRDGPWIRSDGTWDSTIKPNVQGDVA